MPNRSSSEARFHGYRLVSEHLHESENHETHGWHARIVDPDGQLIISGNLDGPFDSQWGAELYAESVVRNHSELKGFVLPADDQPKWEALQNA
jgi:hypothetical protein